MYNRKRIARGAGTAIAVWALVGLLVMSTGTAYALPLAGIGGFTISAEEIEANNMFMYPGSGSTEQVDTYPQMIVEMEGAVLTDLRLRKTIDVSGVAGLSGNLSIRFVSNGQTDSSDVLVKTSAIESRETEFEDFLIDDMNGTSPGSRFKIESQGPVTLKQSNIRAHYLATDSISLPNLQMVACYDPDGDGEYDYGPC
jgi:hypothetical protein